MLCEVCAPQHLAPACVHSRHTQSALKAHAHALLVLALLFLHTHATYDTATRPLLLAGGLGGGEERRAILGNNVHNRGPGRVPVPLAAARHPGIMCARNAAAAHVLRAV